MTNWNTEEIEKIRQSDDLHIAPFREDGVTYGTPTWIWSVVLEGQLYVRAYNGRSSRWYQSAIAQKTGRVIIEGKQYDVSFQPVESEVMNDAIDQAYREKYANSNYLAPMISERTRAATILISPI